jgi:hypothetical protein
MENYAPALSSARPRGRALRTTKRGSSRLSAAARSRLARGTGRQESSEPLRRSSCCYLTRHPADWARRRITYNTPLFQRERAMWTTRCEALESTIIARRQRHADLIRRIVPVAISVGAATTHDQPWVKSGAIPDQLQFAQLLRLGGTPPKSVACLREIYCKGWHDDPEFRGPITNVCWLFYLVVIALFALSTFPSIWRIALVCVFAILGAYHLWRDGNSGPP